MTQENATQAAPTGADLSNPSPEPENGASAPAAPSPELLRLAGQARMLDADAGPAGETQQQQAIALSMAAQNRGELHSALILARSLVLPIIAIKSERKAVMLSAIWTDEALSGIAENGGAVLALHGVALHNLAGAWGPYVGLALSLGPVAIGTAAVLKSKDPEPAQEVGNGQQQ